MILRLGSAVGLVLATALGGCSEPAAPALDAAPRPDAFVTVVDAGPKTYQVASDFPREGCDDNDSLQDFPYLGKWHNLPADQSQEFDSYFLLEKDVLRGILDLIPADRILVDANNLFLHRIYNSTSLAVNLCAVVDSDTLFGHMAKCNGMACELTTLEATLVEPSTQ